MFKVLYAAGNNENSCIQLSRFLRAMQGKRVQIKVAAFKKSSPPNTHIDWTIDCLLNVFRPEYINEQDNENFDTYYQQVKYYKPDLVISDLEYFSSYIANRLNIPLWQCSSSLIRYAAQEKYHVGLFKNYPYLFVKNPLHVAQINNILDNSDLKLVYSHFGDMPQPVAIKKGFAWIRPYHQLGKKSVPCRHNIVSAMLGNNRDVISLLRHCHDTVAFTSSYFEQYADVWAKDINNAEEYYCNLKNCNLFVCQGQTSFLADAFYNGKFAATLPNFKDVECVINSVFSKYYGLSAMVYDNKADLTPFVGQEVRTRYNNVPYLHEMIERLL